MMKSKMYFLIICQFVILLLGNSWLLGQHTRLLYFDPLDDENSTALGKMENYRGTFLPGKGWRTDNETSQLKITLPEGLPFEGTFVINVTNFDPVSQNVIDGDPLKQHIVNLYSQECANKDIFETNGSWWNIRTAAYYSTGPGMAGFKFLCSPAGIDKREEERCMESETWNLNRVYELKVTWTQEKIYYFVDGVQQIVLNFKGQVEPFRYIYLGRDNNDAGYCAQPGPIYSNLRIYVPGIKIKFTDITTSSNTRGYSANGYGNGVAFADLNQDGRVDLLVSNAASDLVLPDLLYMNQGNNQFNEAAGARGSSDPGATHSIVCTDFDNDGDLDLFFSNMPENSASALGRNTLYQNNGTGYFTNITETAGISPEKSLSRGAVSLDLDNDGFLDLYAVNWGEPNEMYRNDGTGKMIRVHRGADGPVEDPALFGRQGVTVADFDNDGDVDIYVCRRQEGTPEAPNWLFVNDGTGNFTEKAAVAGVAVGGRSNGATFADVDNDGDLDLFVINYSTTEGALPSLYAFFNNGNGTFTNRTSQFNLRASGYSILFGDADNDGDLDMFLIRNNQKETGARPELYFNDGTGKFAPVNSSGIEVPVEDARGAGLADIDSDGDLDLYVAGRKGNNFLLRNDTEARYHYIEILCIGPGGDYGGFGSKVSVYAPGHIGEPEYLLGYQESVANFGYLCQNQTALHFGLGEYTSCDIRVTLTNGRVIDYLNLQADQLVKMEKPQNLRISYVSGDHQSGYTQSRLSAPFVVQVQNDESAPQPGVEVNFIVTLGNGTMLEPQPVVTTTEGLARAHLILGEQSGPYQVEARCNADGSPIVFQAEALIPPVYLTKISGDNQAGIVGQNLPDGLVVKATYPGGTAVVNYPVVFTVTSGNGLLSGATSKTVQTNADGMAAVTWTLGTVSGRHKLTASTTDSTVTFTATALADIPQALINVSGQNQEARPGNQFPQPFVTRVQDRHGNPVANHSVQFTVVAGAGHLNGVSSRAVNTDSSGLALANWTTGSYLGPANELIASSRYNGTELVNSPVRWHFPGVNVDPVNSTLTATSPVKANGDSTSKITVVLRDSTNTPVPAGMTVKVLVSGTGNTLTMPDTLTDDNGQVQAYLASTVSESKIIKARVMGLNLPLADSAVVEFELALNSLALVSGNNQNGIVGTILMEPFKVKALDVNQHGIPGILVQFTEVESGANNQISVITNAEGIASTYWTLATSAGSKQVRAEVPGKNISPVIFTVNARPDQAVSLQKVAGDSQAVQADVNEFEDLVVLTCDQYGNPAPDAMVNFISLNGGQVLTPQPVKTNSNGMAACKTGRGDRAGTYRFMAKLEILGTPSVTFTVFAHSGRPVSLVKVAGDNQTLPPGENLFNNLVVKSFDQYNHPTPSAVIYFSALNGGRILTPQPVLADSNGLAACSVALGNTPGVYFYEARLDSIINVVFVATAVADANHPPQLTGVKSDTTIQENQYLEFLVTAFDPDSDAVTLAARNLPVGASFAYGIFQWLPTFAQAGQYEVIFTAKDAIGDSTSLVATIQVMNVNRPPIIYSFEPVDTLIYANYGDLLHFKIQAYDLDQDSLNYIFKVNNAIMGFSNVLEFTAASTLPPVLDITASVNDLESIETHNWKVNLLPTRVELSVFTHNILENGSVQLVWESDEPSNIVGFNILRSHSGSAQFRKMNSALISSSEIEPGKFEFVDTQVQAGQKYDYALEEVSLSGKTTQHGPVSVTIPVPDKIVLQQNYPNPFNPTTAIRFELPEKLQVALRIYNLAGQIVATLVDQELPAGIHTVTWDGRDLTGRSMPSGVYYYRLDADRFHDVKKLVLTR